MVSAYNRYDIVFIGAILWGILSKKSVGSLKKKKKMYTLLLFLLLMIALISLLPAKVLGLAIDTIVSGGLNAQTLFYLVGALILLPISRYFFLHGL